MVKINIALDGPVGSGKTTIGKLLAQKLNYQFLDSGLLYRHFAWFCRENNFRAPAEINKLLLAWEQQIARQPPAVITQLEKQRAELSSPVISNLASQVALLPELRKITLHFQRQLTRLKGWVVVGRDITSTVLPEAEIKIFLTASLAARAQRRQSQYSKDSDLVKVVQELRERDERDQKRANSPLKKTVDSWELDTTFLTPEESLEKILIYLHSQNYYPNQL